MGSYIQKLSFFFLLIVITAFSSCSHTATEIRACYGSVVFEYSDYDSFPESRISVFTEAAGNIRRCEYLSIKSPDKNLSWETDILTTFRNGNEAFVGFNNFVLPDSEKIPEGVYELSYIEADENEIKTTFTVKYDSDFYKLKAKAAEDKIKDVYLEKLAVYDINSTLLYYGEYKSEYKKTKELLNKFKNAYSIQKIYALPDNSVFCILPEEKLEKSKE